MLRRQRWEDDPAIGQLRHALEILGITQAAERPWHFSGPRSELDGEMRHFERHFERLSNTGVICSVRARMCPFAFRLHQRKKCTGLLLLLLRSLKNIAFVF